jgi:hypothetical protein
VPLEVDPFDIVPFVVVVVEVGETVVVVGVV